MTSFNTLGLSNNSNPAVSKAKFTSTSTKKDNNNNNNYNNDDEDDDGAVKVQGLTKIQVGYIRCLLMASIVEKVVAWGRAPLVEGAEAAEPVGAAGN